MAKRAFLSTLVVATGDADFVSPISPAHVQCTVVVLNDANALVEGTPLLFAEINYASTYLQIKQALQDRAKLDYADPALSFVWLDDKGLV